MQDLITNYWTNHSTVLIDFGYNILLAITILLACSLIARGARRFIRRANDHLEKLDETIVPVLCTSATYVIYIVGLVIILDIFGVNTASIITLLGAAGLAIGFALKDTLSNIAAGIMLLILRPFKVGDFIEFGSTMGTIKEINLFATILETFDGIYISSPNGQIWSSTIKNYNRNDKRRLDVMVGISYGDSIDTGLEVLRQIIATEPRFLQEPAPPQTMVISLADSSVNLQLRGWTTTDDYWQTLCDLNKRVKEEVEQAGLSIPFPQMDVHLIKTSE
ncbi:MAG: mechanosensitive ion channel family protein [Desulfobulbaceae bacterium]|nr:mechanosensitive ion channel family protein [Desulfobulbaceae bacterium]